MKPLGLYTVTPLFGDHQLEEIQARSAAQAAEDHAAKTWRLGDDDSLEYEVKDEDTGSIFDVTVDIDVEPSFYAMATKRKAAPVAATNGTPKEASAVTDEATGTEPSV